MKPDIDQWLRSHITMNCAQGNHASEPEGCRGHTGNVVGSGPDILPLRGETCACPCHGIPWPPFVVRYLENAEIVELDYRGELDELLGRAGARGAAMPRGIPHPLNHPQARQQYVPLPAESGDPVYLGNREQARQAARLRWQRVRDAKAQKL